MISLALTLLFLSSPAKGETLQLVGKIYAVKKMEGTPLFVQRTKITQTKDGFFTTSGSIFDATNQEVMRESATIENGQVVRQTTEQLQINERYEFELKDSVAHFKLYKLDSAGNAKLEKENKEKIEGALVTGPSVENFLAPKISGNTKEEKWQANFGVFELARSVVFEFTTKKSLSLLDSAVGVRMAPESFWLSLLVEPLLFDLDKNTGRVIRYRGRTPLRLKVNGNWKLLDADITYEYLPLGPTGSK